MRPLAGMRASIDLASSQLGYMLWGEDSFREKMLRPYLRECFKQSINKNSEFFERERCTHEEKWSKCPIFREKNKEEGLLELSTYPERTT